MTFSMERALTALCNYCIHNHIIQEEDRAIYEYSFYILILSMFHYITCIFIMWHYQCFLLPILFLIVYQFIRSYMGGWHAPSPWLCLVLSLLLFTFAVNIFKYHGIPQQGIYVFSGFSIVLTFWAVYHFGVQDHPNRTLNVEEKAAAKKKCFFLLVIITILMLVSALLQRPNYMLSMALACFFATVIHLLCQILKKGHFEHETQ